jgi:hypothetical protein
MESTITDSMSILILLNYMKNCFNSIFRAGCAILQFQAWAGYLKIIILNFLLLLTLILNVYLLPKWNISAPSIDRLRVCFISDPGGGYSRLIFSLKRRQCKPASLPFPSSSYSHMAPATSCTIYCQVCSHCYKYKLKSILCEGFKHHERDFPFTWGKNLEISGNYYGKGENSINQCFPPAQPI